MYAAAAKAADSQSPHPPAAPISNREPFRLEINATHTKQTPGHDSNRENNALFSIAVNARYRPTASPHVPSLQSNREALTCP